MPKHAKHDHPASARREFLVTCSAAAAAGLFPTTLLAAAAGGDAGRLADPKDLKQRFAALLNGRFRFLGADPIRAGRANLVAVTDWPSSAEVDQFSLEFQVDHGSEIPDGLYHVTAPSGDACGLYVQQVAGQPGRLAAEFSLLV